MKKLLFCCLVLVFISTTHVSAGINDGLVAYYPFSGNADDASGYGNHATVYGATLIEDSSGNPNSAYSLDGIADYIEKTFPSADVNIGDQSWTVSIFIKST